MTFEQAWQRRPMHGAGTPVDGPREKALVELGWRLAHDAAPPADRAELAKAALSIAQGYAEDMVRENYKTAGDTFDKLRDTIDALDRSTDAPSEPVSWGYANTVGNAIAQLKTMDATLPIFGALHLDDGRCIARGLTFSRERVVGGRWIDSRDDSVPYSIVAWTQDRNALATPPAAATSKAPGIVEGEDFPLPGTGEPAQVCPSIWAATSTPCASGEGEP